MMIAACFLFEAVTCVGQSNFRPREMDYGFPSSSPYDPIDRFIPLGWSRDGKIAYIRQRWEEGKGVTTWAFTIQDLTTDQTLWNHDYEVMEGSDDLPSLEEAWKRNEALVLDALRIHGIRLKSDFALGADTLSHDNRTYRITCESEFTYNEDFGLESATRIRVSVHVASLGHKDVYRFSTTGFSGILSARVAGHLKSPFEDRIAIVYVETHHGWEGPPNPVIFKIIGCHLTLGFQ